MAIVRKFPEAVRSSKATPGRKTTSLMALKGPAHIPAESVLAGRTAEASKRIDEFVCERISSGSSAQRSRRQSQPMARSRLEIGMLLAQDPKLLLVDEPVPA